MAKKSRQAGPATQTPFEEARDELFQHVMRCGVVGSEPIDQTAWFDETLQYMTSRFPELSEMQLADLRKLGERFAQPPKRRSEEDAA
ncbi:MAG TPA: hypothetical protein VMH39_02690 [Gemmatimonadaceae bacterium]|nr:hypothetical protein [Gemmatimonadaceae bacterium]